MNVGRAHRVGFVSVDYGGDNEHAIGATGYSSDTSDIARLVNRELNKLLKKYAHKGVVRESGKEPVQNYYWTDGALASGKNWHHMRHSGYPSTKPGYLPYLENGDD